MTRLSFRSDPEQSVAAYRRDGFFVEEGVFSAAECDLLVDRARRMVGDGERDFAPIMMPHRRDEAFLKVMRDRRITDLVRKVIAAEIAGLQSEFFFSKPGTRGFAPHQDNYFVEADQKSFASAWLALVDVSPENGGLILYPGSHTEREIPVRTRHEVIRDPGQDINAYNEELIIPDRYSPFSPMIPQGSIVLIHANVVHGSHDNTSNGFRYALLNTYLRVGAQFRPGRTAQREPVPLN